MIFIKSKYVLKGFEKSKILYFNLKNGVSIQIDRKDFPNFSSLEEVDEIKAYLKNNKFLHDEDELEEINSEYIRKRESVLDLVIMPHQNCNFRCVYCYEKFDKNKMELKVVDSIKKYVSKKLESDEKIKKLQVRWFGGEPLLAMDVIEDLSEYFISITKRYKIEYLSQITTNGYLLTLSKFNTLLDYGVSSFQITLDGNKESHDRQRKLIGGGGTYDKIIANLMEIKRIERNFLVELRMNIGNKNIQSKDDFIKNTKENFDSDKFRVYFSQIKNWGNEHEYGGSTFNDNLSMMCDAMDYGVNVSSVKSFLYHNQSCFAASPNSFVFGVDGLIYKCTVALYDDINIIGNLMSDGTLKLDEEKFDLWTKSGLNNNKCKSCNFIPVCHGDMCPLARIKNPQKSPCPETKFQTDKILNIIINKTKPTVNISFES